MHLYKTFSDKEDTIRNLNNNPYIEYAEPDFYVYLDATYPNDTYWSDLWGLHNTGQTGGTFNADIGAPEAWDYHTGTSNVVVAVIDSGVNYTHLDLNANLWINPGEIPGNWYDDDGNGYIDDIYGINAINGSGDPWDDHFHGTHCAGIIGAVGNNGIGVAGVCWTCRIMALKFLNNTNVGFISDAIECIQYAIYNGADVINASYGSYNYIQSEKDAIEQTKNASILFIAAAGNDGTDNDSVPHFPSSYELDNIIAVAATDHNDELAEFSNYGQFSVDVAAPGVHILSTVPWFTTGYDFLWLDGTSMAAPYVSGLAALMKSYDSTLDWMQTKARILAGAQIKSSLRYKTYVGARINAYNSLTCWDINNTLYINTSPTSGVSIEVSPLDVLGRSNGISNFTRSYNPYSEVNLKAPASFEGRTFSRWERGNASFTDT